MAKHETLSVVVPFGQILWVRELNQARPSGNYGTDAQLKQLRIDLAQQCWLKDVGHIAGEKLTPKTEWEIDGKMVPMSTYVSAEMELRENKRKLYESESKLNSDKAAKWAVFQRLFMKGGKLVVPTVVGITGNRRSSEFEAAMELRLSMKENPEVKDSRQYTIDDIDDLVPINLDDFSNEEYRLSAQTRENDFKLRDFLPSSHVDRLLIVRRMLALGANQNKIRKTVSSDTMGVKLYFICLFNSLYRDLRIIERCQLEEDKVPPDGLSNKVGSPMGPINITQVKHTVLQQFGQRRTPESTDEFNKSKAQRGKEPVTVLTEEEVGEYFRDPTADSGPKEPKMLDKGGVKTMSEINGNPIIKKAAAAILKNDTSGLNKLEEIGIGCEVLMTLRDEGDYPHAETILTAILKAGRGQRVEVFNRVLNVLGVGAKADLN